MFLTVDVEAAAAFWLLRDYFPHIYRMDREIMPSLELIRAVLGRVEVRTVAVPADCAVVSWDRIGGGPRRIWMLRCVQVFRRSAGLGIEERIAILREDLRTGRWARRWGPLVGEDAADLGYRILIAQFD